MSDQQPSEEYQRWRFEQERAVAERHHELEWQFVANSNEAAISNANVALRTLIIVNGGAAITMLAFAGNLVSSDKYAAPQLVALTAPLWWFAWGIAIAVGSMMLAYLTNYSITSSVASRTHQYEHPYVESNRQSRTWQIIALIFNIAAIITALGSLSFFVIGMLQARSAINALA